MLNTKIKNINLETPFLNASGVFCKTKEQLLSLEKNNFTGGIVSKSCTLEKRDGNPHPIYWDDNETLSINSSGLPNMGYNYYIDPHLTNQFSKPYFVSISGLCIEDNLKIISESIKNKRITSIELNLSCPNVIGKPQIGYDFEAMDIILGKVNDLINKRDKNDPVFTFGVKLPPYFDFSHFEKAANIINKYDIDFITCINSLGNGLVVDYDSETTRIKPKGGFGGIGGQVVKPIALANVRKFSELTNCDIIGCGGIVSGKDVFEHILCGAKAVQIGTQFHIEGIKVFERLNNELKEIMNKKGYKNISDFCGKLKTIN